MKKRKVATMRKFDLWSDNIIKIDKEQGQYYFEIANDMTTDLTEAVSIMMRYKNKVSSNFWELEIKDVDFYNISPAKCLYWLSGGDLEWKLMNNYKKSWSQSSLMFEEKFGDSVLNILKSSKKFKDVRSGFIKNLSLPILYEFALENQIA